MYFGIATNSHGCVLTHIDDCYRPSLGILSPRASTFGYENSFDITNAGTLQAIAENIFRDKMNETSPSTTLEDFFGKGMMIVAFYFISEMFP